MIKIVEQNRASTLSDAALLAMKVRGYDIYINKDGKDIFINSKDWNEEKEQKLFERCQLQTFRENTLHSAGNLVIFDPRYYEMVENWVEGVSLKLKRLKNCEVPLPVNLSSMYYMFCKCTDDEIDFSKCNLSGIKGMQAAFFSSSVKKVIFGKQDFRKLISVKDAFNQCRNLQHTDLCEQYLPNLKYAQCCFLSCISLKRVDISSWRSLSLNAMALFNDCAYLESCNISGLWLEGSHALFFNCKNLSNLILGDAIISGESLFDGCTKLFYLATGSSTNTIISYLISREMILGVT